MAGEREKQPRIDRREREQIRNRAAVRERNAILKMIKMLIADDQAVIDEARQDPHATINFALIEGDIKALDRIAYFIELDRHLDPVFMRKTAGFACQRCHLISTEAKAPDGTCSHCGQFNYRAREAMDIFWRLRQEKAAEPTSPATPPKPQPDRPPRSR